MEAWQLEIKEHNVRLQKDIAQLEQIVGTTSIEAQTLELQQAILATPTGGPLVSWLRAPGLLGLPNAIPLAGAIVVILKMSRIF